MTRRGAWLLTAATAALAVAGCGSSSKSSSSSSSTATTTAAPAANATIAAEVPAAVKAKGTLTVAADASYAPNEFIGPDGHTVVGMDSDLATAIGGLMGLKVNVVNQTFDSIIPKLQAGDYQLGMSSFTDTKAREKVVNFVTYFTAGTSFYGKASGAPAVTGLASMCGLTVSVEKGTTEQADATAQGAKCKAAGKRGVAVQAYPDQNGANLAVSSGRAQIGMADSPVAAYAVKQSGGQFKLIGTPYGVAPYGIAVPKALGGFDKAVLDAVKMLMANGTYTSILNKWGIAAGAITNPTINGATS